jgi:hypothetical protein
VDALVALLFTSYLLGVLVLGVLNFLGIRAVPWDHPFACFVIGIVIIAIYSQVSKRPPD